MLILIIALLANGADAVLPQSCPVAACPTDLEQAIAKAESSRKAHDKATTAVTDTVDALARAKQNAAETISKAEKALAKAQEELKAAAAKLQEDVEAERKVNDQHYPSVVAPAPVAPAATVTTVPTTKTSDVRILEISRLTGCPACEFMKPIIKELGSTVPIDRLYVDDQNDADQCRFYGWPPTPTFIVISDGKEVARNVGAMKKDALLSWYTSWVNHEKEKSK
jgi:thiol-disulfide isomerase/thioredoxin